VRQRRARSFVRSLVVGSLMVALGSRLVLAGTFTAFGPETFTRRTGAPVTETRSFSVRNPSTRYTLRVRNAGISSAVVTLNGRQVLGPNAFNQNVNLIEVPVTLQRDNVLTVQLRSGPGSSIVLEIEGVDDDLPSISATRTPFPNAYGWNSADVTVAFVCSDATSSVVSCPSPVRVTDETNGRVVSGEAVDQAGNRSSTNVTIRLDETAPTIAAAPAPLPNPAGWHNTDLTVSFLCADNLSGVRLCADPVSIRTEGRGQLANGRAEDFAGNVAVTSLPVNLDKTPPTIVATPSPAPNAAGWNKDDVTVGFTCADELSGVASCPPAVPVATEGANQTIAGIVLDAAGNSASTETTVSLDKTPPSIVPVTSPPPNAAGWYNTDVTLRWDCADTLSGVKSCQELPVIQTAIVGQPRVGLAEDFAGNTATASIELRIDKTPPTIVASLSPPPNAAGWNKDDVTVAFTCSDDLSGIATCPPPRLVATEGANQPISEIISDLAGNTASAEVLISLDKTPPTVTSSQSPPANDNGWNNGAVVVSFEATDALSGVVAGSVSAPVTLGSDGVDLSASGQATDVAGNVGSHTHAGINIDQTAPTITIEMSPAPNPGGWNDSPLTTHFTCTDAGSGVESCPTDQPIATEGANQMVSGTATDRAGNTASVTSDPFSIDLRPPVVTVALDPAPNASGWNNSAVTAHFTCADTGSGVATCPQDQTVSTEGPGQTFTGTATDNAGHSASATSQPFSIDRTDPTITVALSPPLGPGEAAGGPVTAHFTCTDAGSGVVQCPADQVVTEEGTNLTVSGTVADRAGNTASVTSAPFAIALGPKITDFTPRSARVGTLVTVVGNNLAPNPRITLNRLSGGTLDAPVANATATSIAFVIPAGAATGAITVVVGSDSTGSASPLTITASSDFSIDVQPASANLVAGQSVSFAVSLTSSNAFAQLAILDVSGVPAGASATFAPFAPQGITAGQTSVLTFTAPPGQPTGSANLTITASATVDGLPQSESATAQLNIATATTSLLGRIVVADTLEAPLAGVTVAMLGKNGNGGTTSCSGTTVSDAAGNFLLGGLDAGCVGPQLVGYNGLTATSPEGDYAGVNLLYTLTADQATVSPVLVHLPRIDDKETFFVQQNASAEQTYSYKSIPGLSVTVYAGTTFTLEDGSRPDPFPLVAVQVPVDRLPDAKPPVPTMLSAFIVAFQPANAVASKPAAVFYPNTLSTDPGVNMTLMTLDPTLGRMVPYGTATVSLNGKQIVPDFNPSVPGTRYGIVHFDWHGPMPPPPPTPPERPPINPPPCEGIEVGDPCDVTSGLQVVRATDLAIAGSRGGISVARTYRTLSNNPGPFGVGSNHNYGYFLSPNAPQNALVVHLIVPEGNWLAFSRSSTSEPLVNDTIPSLQGVRMNTFPDGHAEVRWKDGTVYGFAASNALIVPALESITDANRNQIKLTRNSAQPRQITQVTDAVGRNLTLTYDDASRVTTITDPIGRRVQYVYNAQGRLETVTDPEGGVTRYEYNADNRLVKQTNPRGIVTAQNTYESHGRIAQQIQADGGAYRFDYTFLNSTIASTPVLSNAVTDPTGKVTTYRFTPDALLTDVRDRAGQTRVLLRDPERANLVIADKGTAPCATCTGGSPVSPGDVSYTYDDRGNVLTETDALGHVTTYTYEPGFNRVTSVRNALGQTTEYSYDSRGNLLTLTDANGRTTSYTYDSLGQLTETSDALGRKTRFGHDSFGNLTTLTDALGNVTRFRYDGISRLVEVTDSLGRRTRTDYDRLDRVVKQTDARGQITQFTYDAAGNLTALTDARGKTTTFTYDAMNRLKTRTDPLGKTDTRSYDLNGNLISFTDRRGQISTFIYDELDRLKEERYADGSVVKRAYDATSWLIQVDDSAAGSFTYEYDLTGALLTSHGPTGSVKYVRDGLGQVQQRQVIGQPAVDYTYDPVGNVTAASMPQASVTYGYDAVNRPLSLIRRNGVKSDYSYDPVGRLLSIVHSRGTSNLLSLAYSYDATGRRVSQQSSLAQPLVSEPATATYDDANRLIQRGTTSFSYDENGNLTSEIAPIGTVNYVWDARNRLSRLVRPDGQTTQFTYDFRGNLIHQANAGPQVNRTQSYTLDVLTNVAFEQSTDGDQFSVLTAQAIDSHLATIRSNGQAEYALTDAINSTVVTVDQSGAPEGQFSYEPFGETTVTGNGFPFQYTGRPPVFGGLYYYRARYYSASLGKFVSEDPIGFAGGPNVSTYANNNPVSLRDPSGLLYDELQHGTGNYYLIQPGQPFVIVIDPEIQLPGEIQQGLLGGASVCGCPHSFAVQGSSFDVGISDSTYIVGGSSDSGIAMLPLEPTPLPGLELWDPNSPEYRNRLVRIRAALIGCWVSTRRLARPGATWR
jgi:RHS repeat-associated protein